MRKVKNKKAIRRLAVKSFQANGTRNVIAAIAIALTAILFTAVFTIGLGIIETSQRYSMEQAGGDMHGTIKNITKEQYDILKAHPSIIKCGKEMSVAYTVENPEFLKRRTEMHYVEKNIYPNWFIEILDGKAPVEADEILLDEMSMRLLELEPKAGQQVRLLLRLHDTDEDVIERVFTVSGVTKSSSAMNVGFVFVSDAYLEKYADELIPAHEYDDMGRINLHILFSNSFSIQEKLFQVITDSGYSVDMSSPDYIDSNANWAYMSDGVESDLSTLIGVVLAVILILVTGYLIIYNIFQISIIRDIRYYGLLKTIGTTGRQIKKILRRQALWLCLMGIPAGLVLGYGCGKVLVPIVMRVGTDYDTVVVSPKPWIFLGAILFTIITVLISVWRPARIAAKVSPVEALRYTEYGIKRKKLKKSTDGGKLVRMAYSNLGRNKGRTAIVICSLSLMIILLNSIYTITHSLDREGFLSKLILSEKLIGNTALWNYNYRPWDEETAAQECLTESFTTACMQQESFADGGRIYMDMFHVTIPVDSWEVPDNIPQNEEGVPGWWWQGEFVPLSGYEYGTYFTAFHGIDRFVLSKMTVVEGETDSDVIWDKLQTGNYLIYAADVDDNNLIIEEERKHRAGDKITLQFDGDTTKEYEIIAVIKGHQYSLTNRMQSNFKYYVSADEYKKYLPASFLMSFLFDTKEGQEDAMEEFLEYYTTSVEPLMSYDSRTIYISGFEQMIGMITTVGTTLAVLIGLIGVLNFINTILTGIVTRQREFAMMEAIGMTKRQLVKMLTTEGLFYALFTMLFALGAGILFSLTVLKAIGGGLWFMNYRFAALPMLIACPILLILGMGVPKIVYALRRERSIVEEIRE